MKTAVCLNMTKTRKPISIAIDVLGATRSEKQLKNTKKKARGHVVTPFLTKIKAKGWKAKEVAKRWGILPRQFSRISKAPKQKDWDAVEGLSSKLKST